MTAGFAPLAPLERVRPRPRAAVAWPLAVGAPAVAAQLAYPLTSGGVRDVLTVAIVVLLAAACVAHAGATRGPGVAARLLAVTALPGLAVEVLGVHTGIPFGAYAYTGALGPRVLGVPVVVALAWTMLAWPAGLAARRLVPGRAARIVVGAWALVAADLFLDPQMTAGGYWHWTDPARHLPGVPGIPLSNYLGWLVVGLALSAAVQHLLDRNPDVPSTDDDVPFALYLWLWMGWTVALGVFLGLTAAACWGAVAMGTVGIPLAGRVLRRR